MADYVRTQGDLTHSLFATLTDANGPIDLPVGTTVRFVSKVHGELTLKTDRAGSVVEAGAPVGNANRGRVRLDLIAGDVDTPGFYNVNWVVTLPTGAVPQTFPEGSYMSLVVVPTVANS